MEREVNDSENVIINSPFQPQRELREGGDRKRGERGERAERERELITCNAAAVFAPTVRQTDIPF